MAIVPIDTGSSELDYHEPYFRLENRDAMTPVIRKLKLWGSAINSMMSEIYAGGIGGGAAAVVYTDRPTSVTLDRATDNFNGVTNGAAATGTVAHTLWASQAGDTISFIKTGVSYYRIAPATGESIGNLAAGTSFYIFGTGSALSLRCLAAGRWEVISNSDLTAASPVFLPDTTSATLDRYARTHTGSVNTGQDPAVNNIQTLWSAPVAGQDRFSASVVVKPTTGSYVIRPDAAGYIGSGAQGKGIILLAVNATVRLACRSNLNWSIEFSGGDFDYEV